jgi:hypothetical protein
MEGGLLPADEGDMDLLRLRGTYVSAAVELVRVGDGGAGGRLAFVFEPEPTAVNIWRAYKDRQFRELEGRDDGGRDFRPSAGGVWGRKLAAVAVGRSDVVAVGVGVAADVLRAGVCAISGAQLGRQAALCAVGGPQWGGAVRR